MTPLRIWMISEHASPLAAAGGVDSGGQNVYVAEVARALAGAGHRVDVLTRRDSPDLPPVTELASGVRVHAIDAGSPRFVPKEELLPFMPAFATQAATCVPRPQVIHANFFMSGLVGLQLRERWQVPLVTTFHALGLVRREHQRQADRFPPERLAIERELVHESDRVIAACPQDERDLVRLYGAAPERLVRVPCGVDIAALRPGSKAEARARLGIAEDTFLVLQLGRLVPRKGVDSVIRALQWLPGAQLAVVGGDSDAPDESVTPEIGRLRGVAIESGVEARVTFAGRARRDALRDWYVAADVFVTTPWYEPFGITPLEAMACGTPVVGSEVGGIAYTVQHGVTGYLVPPHDPKALAGRIADLRDEPGLRAAMGRAGVHRVRSLFTWDQVAHQLSRVYRSVLQVPTVDAELVGQP